MCPLGVLWSAVLPWLLSAEGSFALRGRRITDYKFKIPGWAKRRGGQDFGNAFG
jgi:hypothetical protein